MRTGLRNVLLTLARFSIVAGMVGAGCSHREPYAGPQPVSRPAGAIRFTDVGPSAGITYVYPRQKRPLRNLEAFGCGCVLFDFDNDGWQDILLVASPHPVLYRNLGNGRFQEVTATVGLDKVMGDWKGCGVGDFDGDGRLDLILSGYHRLALLHNEGARDTENGGPKSEVRAPDSPARPLARSSARHFRDVTVQAGLDPHNHGHWGSSAAFMDLAGDGRLDLVILNYVIFGPKEKQYCELRPGVVSGCPPKEYRPEYGELWRNVGNGRFQDVTAASGMRETHGKGLVVAFTDINGDGRPDFYIGNDGTPADLMRNQGGMRFQNVGETSGVAYGYPPGHAMAAMGADWADYDRDGRMDLAVSGFSDESYSVFHCVAPGLYQFASDDVGIAGPTLKPLGFGTKWLDMDNDGWPDLSFANGHVYDNADQIDPFETFREPMMLFHNEQGRQFVDLVPQLGGDVARPILGRGSATGDIDNDGRIDLLVVDYEGAPILLHNQSQTNNHWITLDLRGRGSNPFAYGAQVTARSGKQVWVGFVSPASSYLSSSDPRVHFGLGPVTLLESVRIRWPDGKQQELRNVQPDRILTIRE